MQTKQLSLNLKLSTIWLILIILIVAIGAVDILWFSYLGQGFFYGAIVLLSIICGYSLYRAWDNTNYQLTISTDSKEVILSYTAKQIDTASIISATQYSFFLTSLNLRRDNGKTVTIPIFIDSVELSSYKKLRILLYHS